MKIPKKVFVLGEWYKVKLHEGLMQSQGIEGFCDAHELTINIDKSLVSNPKMFWKVYFHEVGHAFSFESGLHDSLNADGREFFCQAFASFMYNQK